MKKLHILILMLFTMFLYACVKNDGNEFKPNLPAPEVAGFEKSYKAFTHKDFLKINPTVKNENQYDYYWTVFSSNYIVGTGIVPKGDTIARTKNLDYEVLLNPGDYFLVLNVKDKATKVTQMVKSSLTVSTLNMDGWYFLKDNGGKTDFDYFYNNGADKIENWIAFYNDGKSLPGNATKSIFSPSFKIGVNGKELFNTLVVLTDQDAGVYRIDNGKILMNFDNMFFSKPAVKKPEGILQPMDQGSLFLVNNGDLYIMNKGTFFANFPPSNYKISPYLSAGGLPMFFDNNSKTALLYEYGAYRNIPAAVSNLKNMDADLIWGASYPALRSVALNLFRKPNGEGILAKINMNIPSLYGSSGSLPMVPDFKTIPATHTLMSADVIGGNYDNDYVYYAKGNQIYLTDVANQPENLQITLAAGEQVTCIQHIKYPQPVAGVVNTLDYLVIASYNNGKYKIWLHKISSTGTIQALAQPNFEGNGRVKSINYMEKGVGSRTF